MGQDKSSTNFALRLLKWFDAHGRHDLPWQIDKTPYRVWVSEIMLQQTQVSTVIPYYQRFMQRFPSIEHLGSASVDDVLTHWAGLGYYARGRNLHKAAQIIITGHNGIFPDNIEAVNALPGIGPSTAGAILSLAMNQRHAILDGNVKRSLARYYGIKGYPGEKKTETQLWNLAEQHTPKLRSADYTQAIMDMGAMLCTRTKPHCDICPHRADCHAFKHDLTAQLPQPKPKKKRPVRHTFMLLLIDEQDRLLLFKRPNQGIWGGLYSLPEFAQVRDYEAALKQAGIKLKYLIKGENLKHIFTHFELKITPVYVRLDEKQIAKLFKILASFSREDIGILINTPYHLPIDAKPIEIALPVPIQKLFTTLKRS